MAEHGVILFHTTSSAFAAEKVLIKAGLECRLVPTPREFSSDCGVALRFQRDGASAVTGLLDSAGIDFESIHALGTNK